jgi:hypothetical protein
MMRDDIQLSDARSAPELVRRRHPNPITERSHDHRSTKPPTVARYWAPDGFPWALSDGGFLPDRASPAAPTWIDHVRSFPEIAAVPCLVLIGEPGLGKTTALEQEYIRQSRAGWTHESLLVDVSATRRTSTLRSLIFESPEWQDWRAGDAQMQLWLDALDLSPLHADTIAEMLQEGLVEAPLDRLSIRLTCRNANRSRALEAWLRRQFGPDSFAVYELLPLRRRDVRELAASRLADPDSWLDSVSRSELQSLAANPLTLGMLLDVAAAGRPLPQSRTALFDVGCRLLCDDSMAAGRALTRDRGFATAQRLAGYLILTARSVMALDETDADTDAPHFATLTGTVAADQSSARDGGRDGSMTETHSAPLFADAGDGRVRFRHRTQAEFLCARWLAHGEFEPDQIDDLLFADTDGGPRVIPQLREVTAALAAQSPAFAARLLEHDPVVLVRADPAAWAPGARPALVRALFAGIASHRLHRFELPAREALVHLCHAGLADQLRLFLGDPLAAHELREMSADLAGACGIERLEDALVAVARDREARVSVRVAALAALSKVASDDVRARLTGLVTASPEEDVDDELKGAALFVTWPNVLPLDQLLASLTPAKRTAHGTYHDFLRRGLVPALADDELAPVLDWAAVRAVDETTDTPLSSVCDQLLIRGVAHLEDDEILRAYGHLLVRRLIRDGDVLSSHARTGHTDLFDDTILRRRLLAHLISGDGDHRDLDPAALAMSMPALARRDDLQWAIAELSDCVGTEAEASWAALIEAMLALGAADDAVLAARSVSPELGRLTAYRYGRLDGAAADAARPPDRERDWGDVRARAAKRRPQPFDVHANVASAIGLWADGELDGFWTTLAWMEEVYRRGRPKSLTSDAHEFAGWPLVDEDVHTWLVAAAPRYLREASAEPHQWFEQRLIHRPAWAAYCALRLLRDHNPAALEALPDDVWSRWAPVVVDWPRSGEAETDFNGWAVAELVERAPRAAAEWLEAALIRDLADGRGVDIVRRFAGPVVGSVESVILQLAGSQRLHWRRRGELIDFLLAERSRGGWRLALRLLAAAEVHGRDDLDPLVVHVAGRVAAHAPDAEWPQLRHIVGLDDDRGRELLHELAAEREHPIVGRLTESELGELFAWVETYFPEGTDWRRPYDGSSVEGKAIADWRSRILDTLVSRATRHAVLTLDDLIGKFPNATLLESVRVDAAEAARRPFWVAPDPGQLASMETSDRRWVTSDADLQRVVVAALDRAEEELQGDDAQADVLWNVYPRRPIGPGALWRWVSEYLERELTDRSLIVGRTVEVRLPSDDRSDSDPTQLRIVAAADDGGGAVVADIIGVAGSWAVSVEDAIDSRLVDGGLEADHRHGIYVVGFFDASDWAQDDRKRGLARRHSLAELRTTLARRAADASARRGVAVQAVVLDCSLRTRRWYSALRLGDRHAVSLIGLALALCLACLVVLPAPVAARAIVGFTVLFTLPGAAILTRVRIADPLAALATAIALSLSVDTAVALLMIWTGWWRPGAAAAVLLTTACGLFILDLYSARGGGPARR